MCVIVGRSAVICILIFRRSNLKKQLIMTTNFNFSFGTLTQRGDRVDNLLQRDAAEFARLGYTDDSRSDLKALVQEFRDLPSDDYWLGQQMMKTEAKKKAHENLSSQLIDLRFRAKLALGEKSVEYRALRFGKVQTMKEQDLIIFAFHVSATCREMMDQLAKRNITEAMLDTMDSTATQLDNAIDEQKKTISTREAKSFERQEKANAIYAQIAEICEVGKKIWEDTNQAYYNDYVIYGSQEPIDEDEESLDEE